MTTYKTFIKGAKISNPDLLYFIGAHVFILYILVLNDFDTKKLRTGEKKMIKKDWKLHVQLTVCYRLIYWPAHYGVNIFTVFSKSLHFVFVQQSAVS